MCGTEQVQEVSAQICSHHQLRQQQQQWAAVAAAAAGQHGNVAASVVSSSSALCLPPPLHHERDAGPLAEGRPLHPLGLQAPRGQGFQNPTHRPEGKYKPSLISLLVTLAAPAAPLTQVTMGSRYFWSRQLFTVWPTLYR